ncbi:hypothetical protein AB0F07_15800 [Streptomyces fructofermentans]|uniref:hypothetical protein n=1 Tax=Streptomyces fructofermentans TaxID=152141 RepID=UPI0033F1B7EE
MSSVMRPLLNGAAAGAVGTTALNIAGYTDIVLRGRPVSTTPEVTARTIAEKLHVRIPGHGEILENRIAGLGPLTGFAVGLGMGVALSVARAAGWHPSTTSRYVTASVGALIATNAPIALLGISDPRTWSVADWISDIVPHVLYAAVTVSVLDKLNAADTR